MLAGLGVESRLNNLAPPSPTSLALIVPAERMILVRNGTSVMLAFITLKADLGLFVWISRWSPIANGELSAVAAAAGDAALVSKK